MVAAAALAKPQVNRGREALGGPRGAGLDLPSRQVPGPFSALQWAGAVEREVGGEEGKSRPSGWQQLTRRLLPFFF